MEPWCRRGLLALLLTMLSALALAAEEAQGDEPAPAKWEGAIGALLSYGPAYSGAAGHKLSATPAFYLRYRRFSISNSSGFVSRRYKDDVLHGLGLELVQKPRFRLNLSLRLDHGRRSEDSGALAGLESVRRTVRARASATWQFDAGWRASAGWSVDLLGRGGGQLMDLGASRDRRLTPDTTWSAGAALGWADGRYMRSYYGVSPAASAASGYPVYTPGAGLRSATLAVSLRSQLNRRWVALGSASVGRLLGPAADSPHTATTRQWGVTGGLAWNF